MKTKIIFIALLVITFLLISLNFFQSSDGPHGGKVKKAENYNIEMKDSNGSLHTHL